MLRFYRKNTSTTSVWPIDYGFDEHEEHAYFPLLLEWTESACYRTAVLQVPETVEDMTDAAWEGDGRVFLGLRVVYLLEPGALVVEVDKQVLDESFWQLGTLAKTDS